VSNWSLSTGYFSSSHPVFDQFLPDALRSRCAYTHGQNALER